MNLSDIILATPCVFTYLALATTRRSRSIPHIPHKVAPITPQAGNARPLSSGRSTVNDMQACIDEVAGFIEEKAITIRNTAETVQTRIQRIT